MWTIMRYELKCVTMFLLVLGVIAEPVANAYVVNRTIASTGGCPEPNRFDTSNPATKKISRRWSTSLNANILSSVQTSPSRENEIGQAIVNSFSVWTSVGTSLTDSSLASLQPITTQNACTNDQGTNFDGLNTICFNQTSSGFTCGLCTGVLAFARVVTSDILGETLGASGPSVFTGEILDADIQFRPPDQDNDKFATRQALSSNPSAFDLETVLTHELGHFFGFSHSAVMRAMMYPFAPSLGTFTGGVRCAPGTVCDLPLAEDDRAGLRVLYPNAADPNVGEISGFILPSNPLSLAGVPSPSAGRSVTGIFGTHVVAVDADTGAVVAGTLGGWSCNPATPPAQFDGFYKIAGLPVGHNYKILVEPLDKPTNSTNISGAIADLCRSGVPQPCTVPTVNTNFTTKIKP